ncbi:MAG: glycosyltransferase family 9 protein [Acidobacteria bacterium]|nr:glycosyltransferase family 9 protein [Acidobacteriota bacterium]
MERILIVRLGAMGDVLHGLPAVAALRRAFPSAQIDWVLEPRWAELLCAAGEARTAPRSPLKPLVDVVYEVDTRALRSASGWEWKQAADTLRRIRRVKYEAALDLQGSMKSSLIAALSGAREIVGFEKTREGPAAMFYNQRVMARARHIIEQNLELAATLAGNIAPAPAELPQDRGADSWCELELRKHGRYDYALLSPGVGWGAKRWPAERYGEVARRLAAEGLASYINAGPGEEKLACDVEAASGGTAARISCSLGLLIALTRRAKLFIGGDSGPTHLAAALGIPVVAIFGPTDPERNGPYGARAVVLRSAESRTSYSHTVTEDPGLRNITADQVAEAAQKLLKGGHG